MSIDLNEAKQRLLDKLGPSYGVYIQLLGKWFRGMISKEEFDKSAKLLIEQNFVLEHNKFWLAFFHHCANSATNSIQNHPSQANERVGNNNHKTLNHECGENQTRESIGSPTTTIPEAPYLANKVRCLPNKVLTHMKIFVIAWEMGLDSANDHVSQYINLALQHFLKNIITELICTKTAYRLRENRFKYAIGVKPMNPYLNNSLKIYNSNLEYDPYQIESNKMNSSLIDTYAYNDSLFPSRLYEAQALYEYACSTTSVTQPVVKKHKRLKLSEIFMSPDGVSDNRESLKSTQTNGYPCEDRRNEPIINGVMGDNLMSSDLELDRDILENLEEEKAIRTSDPIDLERRLTLLHLLTAFLSNRTIIPSQSMYSMNIERIFTKLSQ